MLPAPPLLTCLGSVMMLPAPPLLSCLGSVMMLPAPFPLTCLGSVMIIATLGGTLRRTVPGFGERAAAQGTHSPCQGTSRAHNPERRVGGRGIEAAQSCTYVQAFC